jgi:hypothetical protein
MLNHVIVLLALVLLASPALAEPPAAKLDQAFTDGQPRYQRNKAQSVVLKSSTSGCTTTLQLNSRKRVTFSWWEDEPQAEGGSLVVDSYLGKSLLKFDGPQGPAFMKQALRAADDLRDSCE